LPMTIAHPGLFYSRVRERYPQTQTVAPLSPVRETFDVAVPLQLRLALMAQDELPRAWFVSQDDAMVIQLQSDRFLLNWRRGAQGAEYPHFEVVTSEFRRAYAELEAFVAENELGEIEPNQCEMTYINHLESIVPGSDRPDPASLLRLWAGKAGPEWNLAQEDIAFTVRYRLRDKAGQLVGRVIATLTPLVALAREERILQLEITARGTPAGTGLPAVIAFHEMAHEHIVRCFTGITTKAAHKIWERWQ
jgi:uncharacterized protein (TIGR04255 family)